MESSVFDNLYAFQDARLAGFPYIESYAIVDYRHIGRELPWVTDMRSFYREAGL